MSEIATGTYQDLSGGLVVNLAPEKLIRRDRPLSSPDLSNVCAEGADLISRRGWTRWLDLGANKRAYMVTFISALTLGDLLVVADDAANYATYASFQTPTFPPVPQPPTTASGLRITAPVHGATCQLLELPIGWTFADNATAYRVMIHTARTLPTANDGPIDPTKLTWWAQLPATANSVTVPAGKLVNATVYYLWVDALVQGRWLPAAGAPHKFTTKLLAPTGLTTGAFSSLTPALAWDANFAAAWIVQIRQGTATTAEQFAALPIIHTSALRTQANYTVPGGVLQTNTIYSYVVTARDVAQGTPGCEIASLPATITVFNGPYWELAFPTDAFYADGSGGNYTLTGMPSSPQLVPASALVNEGGWMTWRSAAGTLMTRVSNGATYANPKVKFYYRLYAGRYEVGLAFQADGFGASLEMAAANIPYDPAWPTNNWTVNSGGVVTPHGTVIYHA